MTTKQAKSEYIYIAFSGTYALVERYMGGATVENIATGFRCNISNDAYAMYRDAYLSRG